LLFSPIEKPFKLETKQDPEMEIGGKNKKLFVVKSDWSMLENAYADSKEDVGKLVKDLIVAPVVATIHRGVSTKKGNAKKAKQQQATSRSDIANAAIQTMTYPEFQLC
jgi:hypothetical protein